MEPKRGMEADAVYIYLDSKPYAYGKDLDDERHIDYAADGTPIGVELLCVSSGVNVSSLPRASEIAELLEAERIGIYFLEQHAVVFNIDLPSLPDDGKAYREAQTPAEVTA